jgi:putative DNA primase/helicase
MTPSMDRFESVPQMMKTSKRWLLWRSDDRNGKPSKVPYSITGSKASVNDPKTWTTFELAVDALDSQGSGFSGIGFVLGDGFLGIDIDNCITEDLTPNAWAMQVAEAVGSYTEISPSGRGLHMIAKGSLPPGPRRTRVGECRLEMYDAARYFTVTGRLFDSRFSLLTDAQDAVDQIYRRHFEQEISPKFDASDPGGTQTISAAYVLNQLEKLSNSESAKALFNGDDSAYRNDKSAADLAFCCFARQALGSDADVIDRAYRVSSRYRPKWDRLHSADGRTYGTMTIQRSMQISPQAAERGAPCLRLIPASEVRIEAIDWFMPNRVPKSELVIFEGDGWIGKTTAALDIIARATAGRPLPDGTVPESRPNVLILAEEDGLSMLTARLRVAGADLSRISFIDYVSLNGTQQAFIMPDHAELLREAIENSGASLFYLDALFSHFNPKLNATLYQHVRIALAPLNKIAHETKTTIIVTRHLMKAVGTASARGLGSVDVRNMARAVLTFGPHPSRREIPPVYVVAVSKSNYGQSAESLLYRIKSASLNDNRGTPFDVGMIDWLGTDSTTADEVTCAKTRRAGMRPFQEACMVLKDTLGTAGRNGLTAEALERIRVDAGITAGTWVNARAYLNQQRTIKRRGGGQAGPVRWYLVSDDTDADSHIA